jgi:hypothetical protein
MLKVVKRISGYRLELGGEQHSGWLPSGAAIPPPTPLSPVELDLEIQYDGGGYLLCYESRDGEVHGDTWHSSLEEAERAAAKWFDVQPTDWQGA